jgi:UDP-glucose 4-epimerase
VKRALITGGAGFIGSTLAERLLADGHEVVVYDSFVTGQRRFVEELAASPRAEVIEGDVLDAASLREAMAGCDTVFHLAANADVRFGLEDPSRDFTQNTTATFMVLEAMRAAGAHRILFASSGSVYGEPDLVPTPERAPFPVQTSLYGASKLAGEAMIQAYCEGYGFTGVILRFVSVLGERYTHGHLFDFSRALRSDPSQLTVLGDGRQRKSYLYVGDCVEAILLLARRSRDDPGAHVFNLGTDEVSDVDTSVRAICAHLGVNPRIEYTGGVRGWVGDSPLIHLDCSQLRALGWTPALSIAEAIGRTLGWFDANEWVFGARPVR